jgi:hypothetical protein
LGQARRGSITREVKRGLPAPAEPAGAIATQASRPSVCLPLRGTGAAPPPVPMPAVAFCGAPPPRGPPAGSLHGSLVRSCRLPQSTCHRRPRPRMCSGGGSRSDRGGGGGSDGGGNDVAANVVNVVERTARGHRLYVTDMSESECDVFEDFRARPGKAPPDDFVDGAAGVRGGGVPSGADDPRRALWKGPLGRLFRSVMLPVGFPDTVTAEFLPYAGWVVGRNAFRKANYVLGTSTLLYALGLSAESTLTFSVALNWILKDGLGLVSKVTASTQISRVLDRDPKLWRFGGDVLMVASVLVELLAPLRPSFFLLFGSASSLLREVADAMSGPSYRVFLQSMAIDENQGDVSSRSEIHVVIGTIIGLAVGASTTSFMSTDMFSSLGVDRSAFQAAAFCALSFGHLFCTRAEVSTIELRALNRKRLDLILSHFVETDGDVPSVSLVNEREKLFAGLFTRPRVVLGGQLLDFVECGGDVRRAVARRNDGCMVAYGNDGRIGIMLEENVTERDVLRAMLLAQHLTTLVDDAGTETLTTAGSEDVATRERVAALVEASYRWTAIRFAALESGLDAEGWTRRLIFDTGAARFREGGGAATPETLSAMHRQLELESSRD